MARRMALTDPLQFVVIWVLFVGGVIALVAYVLFRIIRLMNKAEKYFDSKAKESKQDSAE
jgi:hypothetical protein